MPPVAPNSKFFTLMLVITTVAVLYLAKEVLVPFALAVLISFLLAPLVSRLEHWRLGRIPAVGLVVTLALALVAGAGWVVAEQMMDLAENLPQYRLNIIHKVQALNSPRDGVLGRLQKALDEVETSLSNPKASTASDDPHRKRPAEAKPIPVKVVEAKPTSITFLGSLLTPVMGVIATAGVVILFVLFMLIEREDLRNRLIRLVGTSQISVTTQALDDAARRVSRYLLMQMAVNGTYGLIVGIGLYFIGIPNAIVWGLLAALLRYIPYLGPWVGAAMPIAISLAVFDSWRNPLLTTGLFIALELILSNIMEPVLYRSSTGISTIGILVAAVFWTWLWGGVGLVMSTPMTVCIAVLGRYVPHLNFLTVLLSDEPVLEPGPHYYQRLLAGDREEASKLVEKYLETHSLEEVYGEVILPALALAEEDGHRGGMDEGKQAFVRDSILETVEELPERSRATAATVEPAEEDAAAKSATASPAAPSTRKCVICLPARDEADEIAGIMLVQLLEQQGHCARTISVKALASEMLDQVAESNVGMVFVSALPPFAVTQARYLCKRLRARFPELKIVVGLWHSSLATDRSDDRLKAAYADHVVTTLAEALAQV